MSGPGGVAVEEAAVEVPIGTPETARGRPRVPGRRSPGTGPAPRTPEGSPQAEPEGLS